MGAFDILHHLRERGLTVEPGEPGRVIVRPASKLTDDLREQIRAHKAEIIDRLAADRAAAPAHQAREQRQPHDDLPRLTPEQVRALIGWDDAEIAQAGRYMRQADRHGFDLDLAERITDHLMLRDRQRDDRRMCLECSHLDRSGRCSAARAGRLPGAGRDLQPVKVALMRCPGFQTNTRN
jgi:hypothetical protein